MSPHRPHLNERSANLISVIRRNKRVLTPDIYIRPRTRSFQQRRHHNRKVRFKFWAKCLTHLRPSRDQIVVQHHVAGIHRAICHFRNTKYQNQKDTCLVKDDNILCIFINSSMNVDESGRNISRPTAIAIRPAHSIAFHLSFLCSTPFAFLSTFINRGMIDA